MIDLECTCADISKPEWDKLMKGAVKTNGKRLRNLIKKELPKLYNALALYFYNPYEDQSQETSTHYIYVHSAIEYFLRK